MKKNNNLDIMQCDYCDRKVIGYDDIWLCECGAYCTSETSFSWEKNSNKSKEIKSKINDIKAVYESNNEMHKKFKVSDKPISIKSKNTNTLYSKNYYMYKIKENIDHILIKKLNNINESENDENFIAKAKELEDIVLTAIINYD